MLISESISRDARCLRELAYQWMEIATSAEMKQRRKDWGAIRDLKGEHPMIKCDAFLIDGYVPEETLICQDKEYRQTEKMMRGLLRQYREVGDDVVLNDVWHIPWKVDSTEYSQELIVQRVSNGIGYAYKNQIEKVEDIDKLKKRSFSVDRKSTNDYREKMEYAFDGILPVRVGNVDYAFDGFGFNFLTGNYWCNPLTELFKYVGYERLMVWMVDEPEAIHSLMQFFTDERLRELHFYEEQGLLDCNTDGQFAGTVSYGFCSDLPQRQSEQKPAALKDLWGWCEAQEDVVISPNYYKEFVAPYFAQLAKEFGLVHYGCCERHDDRYSRIVEAIPNVRSFTATYKWNNIRSLYEQCHDKQAIVCKPSPENICSKFAMWEGYETELRNLAAITHGKNLEIIIGDIFTVYGDWSRFSEAVTRYRRIMGL